MKEITKTIRRLVRVHAVDPALPDAEWVVKIGPDGLTFRRHGTSRKNERKIGWRSIIGTTLVHVRSDSLGT